MGVDLQAEHDRASGGGAALSDLEGEVAVLVLGLQRVQRRLGLGHIDRHGQLVVILVVRPRRVRALDVVVRPRGVLWVLLVRPAAAMAVYHERGIIVASCECAIRPHPGPGRRGAWHAKQLPAILRDGGSQLLQGS